MCSRSSSSLARSTSCGPPAASTPKTSEIHHTRRGDVLRRALVALVPQDRERLLERRLAFALGQQDLDVGVIQPLLVGGGVDARDRVGLVEHPPRRPRVTRVDQCPSQRARRPGDDAPLLQLAAQPVRLAQVRHGVLRPAGEPSRDAPRRERAGELPPRPELAERVHRAVQVGLGLVETHHVPQRSAHRLAGHRDREAVSRRLGDRERLGRQTQRVLLVPLLALEHRERDQRASLGPAIALGVRARRARAPRRTSRARPRSPGGSRAPTRRRAACARASTDRRAREPPRARRRAARPPAWRRRGSRARCPRGTARPGPGPRGPRRRASRARSSTGTARSNSPSQYRISPRLARIRASRSPQPRSDPASSSARS